MELTPLYATLGFLLAAYSVIGNDSVQTLGTFISSNRKTRWYWMWLAASAVLIFAVLSSWITSGGDISHGRLESIPYQSIEWYHLLGPLVLLLLTLTGIPVSTTFMVLSLFASTLVLEKMLIKSFIGYGVGASAALIIWWGISAFINEDEPVNEKNAIAWRFAQWITTGLLWYTWLSHDMANIAVFLPRDLSVFWLLFVILTCVIYLGIIFYIQGGKIQNIVLEKSSTEYVRSATLIDFVLALLLLCFKQWNSIPMSTTWVFVGLLCGREIAIYHHHPSKKIKAVFPLVLKDFLKMMVGLSVSVGIALLIHEFIAP